MHFVNAVACDVACVRCLVHMRDSWEGLRLFEKKTSSMSMQLTTSKDIEENKTNKRSIEGKLFGYIFTVLTLNFALDSTLESFQNISVMRWELNSLLDWFRFLLWTKKKVPKSNINGSESEYYKRCFNPNKTICSRWSKLIWRLQVQEPWKIVAWLTCLSSLEINTWLNKNK